MRNYLANLEAKMMVAGGKVLAPFKNRKAIDEGSNTGLRGTVSLVVTLLIVALVVIMAVLVVTNGNEQIAKVRDFFSKLKTTAGTIQ